MLHVKLTISKNAVRVVPVTIYLTVLARSSSVFVQVESGLLV